MTFGILIPGEPKPKPRKRTVYVLEWLVDYEPGHVSGVFSTKKRAEKAMAAGSGMAYKPDDWRISKVTVDAWP